MIKIFLGWKVKLKKGIQQAANVIYTDYHLIYILQYLRMKKKWKIEIIKEHRCYT